MNSTLNKLSSRVGYTKISFLKDLINVAQEQFEKFDFQSKYLNDVECKLKN